MPYLTLSYLNLRGQAPHLTLLYPYPLLTLLSVARYLTLPDFTLPHLTFNLTLPSVASSSSPARRTRGVRLGGGPAERAAGRAVGAHVRSDASRGARSTSPRSSPLRVMCA